MKTSSKIILITIIFILSFSVFILIYTWTLLSDNESGLIRIVEGSSEMKEKTIAASGFNCIDVSGFCEIVITRDNSFNVTLSAPEYFLEQIKFTKAGEKLTINQVYYSGIKPISIKIKIKMPSLKEIKASGNTTIEFSDFNAYNLSLDLQGFNNVKGLNSEIGSFRIRATGTFKNDLDSCKITNADLTLSGTGDTYLNMAGGILSGNINGTQKVFYKGSVSEQKVMISGNAKVEKKD